MQNKPDEVLNPENIGDIFVVDVCFIIFQG